MIRHVAVLPSTPLLLPGWPGQQHTDVAAVAAAAARVLAGVGQADAVVLLAGGPATLVLDALDDPAALGLGPYGWPEAPAHALAAAPDGVRARLAAAVPPAARPSADPGPPVTVASPAGTGPRAAAGSPVPTGSPVTAGSPAAVGSPRHHAPQSERVLSPDLVVLARHLPAGTPAVGVAVAAEEAPAGVAALSAAVLAAADATPALAVVCAGDLGAGHGEKPPRPGAAAASRELQDRVVAALDGGRPADLVRLDAALAAASASRAVGALRVLGAVLHAARVGTVVRTAGAPLGVGYVVAQGG
jgi:hypothetical protein